MTRRFSGVIAIEGVQTGDGRIMADGSLTWAALPIPLAWLMEEQHGNGGAGGVQIGVLDSISRNDAGEILGSGMIDDQIPEGAEVVRRMEAGTAPFGSEWGISIDADDYEVELIAPNGLQDDEEVEILVASARQPAERAVYRIGYLRLLPLLPLLAAAGDGDEGGELLMEASADEVIERAVRLRIRGATLVSIPAFDAARISLASDDLMPEDEPTGDEPVVVEDEPMAVAASVFAQGLIVAGNGEPILAAGFPIAPPVAWFDDPQLDDPTPLTVDENGRVYGHIATFDRCYVGMPGCTTAPKSNRDYDLFLTGAMRCVEGCEVRVGTITANVGHAPKSMSLDASVEHYADTRLAAAYVAVGEDRFGIWVAGTVRPDLSPSQLVNLRASKPSGDWRPFQGQHELIAVLMVNVPGFPVTRPIAASAIPQAVLDMAAERLDGRFVKSLDEKYSRTAAPN